MPFTRLLELLQRVWNNSVASLKSSSESDPRAGSYRRGASAGSLLRLETSLRNWTLAGTLLIALVVALVVLVGAL